MLRICDTELVTDKITNFCKSSCFFQRAAALFISSRRRFDVGILIVLFDDQTKISYSSQFNTNSSLYSDPSLLDQEKIHVCTKNIDYSIT